MVHPYYEISQKGLEDNNTIQIQIDFNGSKDFVENNQTKIQEYLTKLNIFSKENLIKDIDDFMNLDTENDFEIDFEIESNGFIDNKKKIESIADEFKELSQLVFCHDITGLEEEQVVNLSYLRNISLNSGYIVKFNFQYFSESKENLIKSLKKGMRTLCKDFYDDSEDIFQTVWKQFNENDLIEDEGKYYGTIHFDMDESLKEYLSTIDFYEDLLQKMNDVAELFDTSFAYDVTCSNSKSEEVIFIY